MVKEVKPENGQMLAFAVINGVRPKYTLKEYLKQFYPEDKEGLHEQTVLPRYFGRHMEKQNKN